MRQKELLSPAKRTPAKKARVGILSFLQNQLRKTRLLSRRKLIRRRGSLVRRFQFLLMTWGVIIYLMAVAGFWFASNNVISTTFEQQAMEWSGRVTETSRQLLVEGGLSALPEIEDYLHNYEEISFVALLSANDFSVVDKFAREDEAQGGTALIAGPGFSDREIEELRIHRKPSIHFDSKANLLRVVSPIVLPSLLLPGEGSLGHIEIDGGRSNIVGYTDVGINVTSYKDQLAKNVLIGSLLISMIFLIAAIVGRMLITNALKPLLDLQEPLNRLARGEMDFLVSREGDEEIVAISKALNSTISAIKGRDAELRRLADYDALTGLINKRSFNLQLEKERRRIQQSHDGSALFFIDLDQFKYINDTLGHTAGDRLLIQVADLLKSRMRAEDVVCRLGGDEFAVLARSVDREGAIEIANSLVKSMYDFMFVENGKAFNIYCSIGVALLEEGDYTTDEIFSHADMACYTAKSQGRNRFKLFEPDNEEASKVDIGWSHRIANALANDSFVLHYQPIIGIGKEELPSFEVLLRMVDDCGEVIPPNMFIPVAERFGLATEIDYWVIRNSMSVLEQFNRIGKRVRLYVNLSGQLLDDPDFIERVLDIYNKVDIDAEQIVFELTERAAVGNIQSASDKMTQLCEYGFMFAVDDFGSGFSSFSYLKYMPVQFVKIEGEFVERIVDDEVDRALVKSMVDIAKACGKKVVAEFVCNQRTLELLRDYGIDYAQGFYLATPSEEPVLADFYKRARGLLAPGISAV